MSNSPIVVELNEADRLESFEPATASPSPLGPFAISFVEGERSTNVMVFTELSPIELRRLRDLLTDRLQALS